MEEDDDRRKRPIFYWKAFHLYPIILMNEEEFDIEIPTEEVEQIVSVGDAVEKIKKLVG